LAKTQSESAVIPHSQRSDLRLDWSRVLAIGGLHVGCLLAPFYFSWSAVGIALVLLWVGSGLGITLCYHRLLTHRSFTVPKWLEYALTICGCLNWQGGPIQWVGGHRLHHRDSDQPGDPHSPVVDGFAWSHIMWVLYKDNETYKPAEAAKDLARDPGLVFINKWFYVPQFILAGLLFGVGYYVGGTNLGLSWVVWGICVRTVVAYHGTWFVNSAAHTWGYRNFETTDGSRNSWWVAALSFGEGWHNNHHAFQRSAAHGLRWYELDVTYMTIRLLSILGLAKNVVLPEPEQLHVTRPRSRHIKVGIAATTKPAVTSSGVAAGQG
jgi:fatty-acid desaturase